MWQLQPADSQPKCTGEHQAALLCCAGALAQAAQVLQGLLLRALTKLPACGAALCSGCPPGAELGQKDPEVPPTSAIVLTS